MASLSSSALPSAASSVPAAASAGVVTSANGVHGFRPPSSVMASIPRFFAKMASLGYLGTESNSAPSPAPVSQDALTTNATAAAAAASAASAATQNSGNATSAGSDTAAGAFDGSLRSMGSVFTYATSKWAVMCLFMTVLLNRTMIYAALRRPIRLPFKARLMMRIIPVLLLAYQVNHMLRAMRCQTAAMFQGEARAGGADTYFHAIGRAGSFWLDDRAVCEAIGMIPDSEWIDHASSIQDIENPETEIPPPKGSLDILWPLYQTLSFSQFVEVFTCALVGRAPLAETGMTLLEHSLAFAEAEALATRKTYRLETANAPNKADSEDPDPAAAKGDIKVFKIKGEKLIPAEVLYISIISSMSHITSHVMAVFNRQARYRLLTSGFYGIAFLAGFAVALFFGGASGILDFPTVSVVGFIPHLLIFAGISVCGAIYGLALLLSSLFPPSGRRSFSEGYQNLRANLTFSSAATIALTEDFYSVLLKLGYMCLTAAAEATYLNEGRAVRVPVWTWLEAERARMLDSRVLARAGGGSPGQFLANAKGAGPFAMERKDFSGVVEGTKEKGRTATGARWVGAGELLRGVGAVLGRWGLVATARMLGRTRQEEAGIGNAGFELEDEDEVGDGDYEPSENGSASSSPSSEDEDEGEGMGEKDGEGGEGRDEDSNTRGRSATPLLDPFRLAALLDPQSPEDRAAARLLARHLVAPAALTRRQYSATQLSGIAEEAALESILLSRRRKAGEAGEGDEGSGGPVCVVCQCEPRTVIVWPCRCLCLCEDCRVCLAMNNWSSCVTCRGKCVGYSRIYVP